MRGGCYLAYHQLLGVKYPKPGHLTGFLSFQSRFQSNFPNQIFIIRQFIQTFQRIQFLFESQIPIHLILIMFPNRLYGILIA